MKKVSKQCFILYALFLETTGFSYSIDKCEECFVTLILIGFTQQVPR